MIELDEKRNWSRAYAATSGDAKKDSDYEEAYKLSLELCNDPKTASRVATRFIEDVQTSDEAPTENGKGDEQ